MLPRFGAFLLHQGREGYTVFLVAALRRIRFKRAVAAALAGVNAPRLEASQALSWLI